MEEHQKAMAEIDRQRASLAGRIQLPWWYAGLFGLAVFALLATPWVTQVTSFAVAEWGLTLPAIVVLLLWNVFLGRLTGARIASGTLRAYPSSRPAGLTMLAVVVVGIIGVHLLLAGHELPFAILVSVVFAMAATRCLLWQTAGIRKDIREGRAVTP